MNEIKKCRLLQKRAAVLIFLVSLLPQDLLSARFSGHNVRFEHFSLNEGLSQSSVTCIQQDEKGFLWFGTQDGLNRYDGYSFKIFRREPDNPNSLSHNYVRAVTRDRKGNLWIGTDAGGLNKYNPRTDTFTHYHHNPDNPNSLAQENVRAIFEDESGDLWIGTYRKGLSRLNPRTGAFTHYKHRPGDRTSIISNHINAICRDTSGALWIGTEDGLARLDLQTATFSVILRKAIYATLVDRKHGDIIWIGTMNSGLYRYNKKSGEMRHFPQNSKTPNILSHTWVNAIFQDREGILWLGTLGGGVNRFDPKSGAFIRFVYDSGNPHSLNNNRINSIYRDKGGILWFGTGGGGINKLDLETTVFHNFDRIPGNLNSLSNSMVESIYETREGILWIGTLSGLNRYDTKSGTFKRYYNDPGKPGSIRGKIITAITQDKVEAGILWIGTDNGLIRFDTGAETSRHYFHDPGNTNSLSANSISAIYSEADGVLWIGSYQSGINRFDPRTGIFTRFTHDPANPASLSDNNIFFIHRDQTGFFWFGTADGLNKFDPVAHSFKVYLKSGESKDTGRIVSICEEKPGILWVGTLGGGLIKFDPKSETYKQYGIKEGLLNTSVWGILQDEQENLWLSTNDGLFKFNPGSDVFNRYDERDGLPSSEFNVLAYHKGYSGRLYFGGIKGVTTFYGKEVKKNTHLPPVVITKYQKFNREEVLSPPIWETTELHISYKDDVISFEFAALDFAAPEKNRYMYKMEGFNKDWVSTASNQRFAGYTNLDPGSYTFMVKASNNHDLWNDSPTHLKIVINPPFWNTSWFHILLVLIFLIGIYFFQKIGLRVVEKQKKALEEKVNERTEALKTANKKAEQLRKTAESANRSKSDFLARMSHEIRTPMNSIIGFTDILLETKLDVEQRDYMQTINSSGEALLSLINDILDFSKVESGQLALESISFNVEEISCNACKMIRPKIGSKPVDLICRIDDTVPLHVKGDPVRFQQVLVNLLGNAVKFTEDGEIHIEITVEKETNNDITLHTSIKDTGIGIPADKIDRIFEVFQQVDETTTRKFGGSGLGLAICKQISRLMHGDILVESEPGKGSTFHFLTLMQKVKEEVKEDPPNEILQDKKILIVDDNRHNIEILSHTLGKAGMKATGLTQPDDVVSTLLEALAKNDPFQLCILDIRMPEISGYEVAKQVRGLSSPVAKIPLLAFSSSTSGRINRYRDFGFDAFLPKPARKREVLAIIEELFQKGSGEKEKTDDIIIPAPESMLEVAVQPCLLLAEDNPINRKLAGFILNRAGYRYEIAENGKEAVEKFTRAPDHFDLILMDVRMPVMDGIAAVKIIRERGFTRIPIVAMTAQSMKGDREKCLKAGMDDYISKPIRKASFLKVLKKYLK